MKKYVGTKTVLALAMTLGSFIEKTGVTPSTTYDLSSDGYLVEYTDSGKPNTTLYDGYVAWSPKEVFETHYFEVHDDPGENTKNAVVARAKYCVNSVLKDLYDGTEHITMSAVTSGSKEDNTFHKYTPYGEFKISISNEALHGQFKSGQKYYLDFTLADK